MPQQPVDDFTDEEVEDLEYAITDGASDEREVADRRIHPLTNEEREICVQVKVKGVDYLRYELRWSSVKIKAFLSRVAVQAEMEYLERSYNDRSGIQERTRFFSQIRINQMVPAAIATVARALRGDVMDESGEITRAPSRAQYEAACMILDRADIAGNKTDVADQMPKVDSRSVNIYLGDDEDEFEDSERISRDKVRGVLDDVMSVVKDGDGKKKKRAKKKKRRKKAKDT